MSYSEQLVNLNEQNNFFIDRIKRLQPNTLDLDYLEEKLRKNTDFSKKQSDKSLFFENARFRNKQFSVMENIFSRKYYFHKI